MYNHINTITQTYFLSWSVVHMKLFKTYFPRSDPESATLYDSFLAVALWIARLAASRQRRTSHRSVWCRRLDGGAVKLEWVPGGFGASSVNSVSQLLEVYYMITMYSLLIPT